MHGISLPVSCVSTSDCSIPRRGCQEESGRSPVCMHYLTGRRTAGQELVQEDLMLCGARRSNEHFALLWPEREVNTIYHPSIHLLSPLTLHSDLWVSCGLSHLSRGESVVHPEQVTSSGFSPSLNNNIVFITRHSSPLFHNIKDLLVALQHNEASPLVT